MKNISLLLALMVSVLGLCMNQMSSDDRASSAEAESDISDRLALKALVDEFSILADKKDVAAQLDLFTEGATVESFREGAPSSVLTGKDEIGNAFSNFLSLFEIVYHINGQQTVDIEGDTATGVSYCLVVLIGEQGGQKMKTTLGVSYEDEYVKENGTWLIANRKSYFNWQEVNPIQ